MRLLLVRHGVAEGQEGRAVGHTDPPLAEQGRKDIAALWAWGLEPPALLLSSDLRRASQSAELLAAHWGIEVVTDVRLRELHFGEWENRSWRELEREDGARLGQWMRDWTTTRTPGGESFADLVARTTRCLVEWEERRMTGTTLVVAHAGSIRAILCRLLNVPLGQAFEFEVHPASVIGLDFTTTRTITKARNSRKHEVSVHHHPFNGQSGSVEVE